MGSGREGSGVKEYAAQGLKVEDTASEHQNVGGEGE